MPLAGLLQSGDGLRRLLPDKFRRQRQIEFLAQHGPHHQQVDGGLRQEFDAAGEESAGPTRGVQIGHGQRLDAPAVRLRHQGPRFHHAAQHGGGHERAAVRPGNNRIDRRLGQRPGHRLRQPAHVVRFEEGQPQVERRTNAAEDVVRGDFLRTEGGHHEHVRRPRAADRRGSPANGRSTWSSTRRPTGSRPARPGPAAPACPRRRGTWKGPRCCGLRRTLPAPAGSRSANPARRPVRERRRSRRRDGRPSGGPPRRPGRDWIARRCSVG